ncbi:MAG: hypothetical protein ACREQL_15995, partial [Candidatus Binatia bacterium]
SVLVAVGPATPLYDVYRALPLLGSFRYPDRMLGIADYAFAIAAAIGLDAVVYEGDGGPSDGRPPRRTRRGAIAALVAVLLVVALALHGHAPLLEQGGVVVFALVTALVVVARLVAPDLRPAAVATALLCLVLAQVVLAPWRLPVAYATNARALYRRYEYEYRAIAARAGSDRAWIHAGAGHVQPQLALKLAMRFGVRTIDDYEPLAPRRQAEYFTFFTEGAPQYHRPPWLFDGAHRSVGSPPGVPGAATRRRLLDLAAVRFVVLPAGMRTADPAVDAFVTAAGLEPRPLLGTRLTLYENRRALPRAYVVYRARRAPPPAELLAAIADESFDPLVESYVEGDPGFTLADDPPTRGEAAHIAVDGEGAVEVDATLARAGLVVLADAFYPGWRATVDGTPGRILPTNHLFRGVPVPAGVHRVRFEYRPTSVVLGAVASVAGWGAIALLALRARRRAYPPAG